MPLAVFLAYENPQPRSLRLFVAQVWMLASDCVTEYPGCKKTLQRAIRSKPLCE
jgi:hypothetical protein